MEKYLSLEDVIRLITTLSHSQGFYGRLLRDINEMDEEGIEKLRKVIEEKKFKDNIEFILWIEGGE